MRTTPTEGPQNIDLVSFFDPESFLQNLREVGAEKLADALRTYLDAGNLPEVSPVNQFIQEDDFITYGGSISLGEYRLDIHVDILEDGNVFDQIDIRYEPIESLDYRPSFYMSFYRENEPEQEYLFYSPSDGENTYSYAEGSPTPDNLELFLANVQRGLEEAQKIKSQNAKSPDTSKRVADILPPQ